MKPCSACQGSGKRTVHEVTGNDVDYGPCPVCKGTGEVPEEEEKETEETPEGSPEPPAPAATEPISYHTS